MIVAGRKSKTQIYITKLKFGKTNRDNLCKNQKIYLILLKTKAEYVMSHIPNPNSCSSRIPMNRIPNIFANRWKTPPCSHIQVMRRQPWCLRTTLFTSRAPIFCSLSNITNCRSFDHNNILTINSKFEVSIRY
jgi:hypothetical protein